MAKQLRILVTGGSGILGSQVVQRLQQAGHQPIVFSRRESTAPGWVRGDLSTGAGLAQALAGVDVVVHAASAAAESSKVKAVDIEGTHRLLKAAAEAGVKHLLYVSIVGVDKIPYAYFKAKLAGEDAVQAGVVPWTILRATQFPELIDRVLRASRGPFVFVPRAMSFQPVNSGDVAERLAELAVSAPARMLEDFGGPEVLTTRELAHAWLARRGLRKWIVEVPVPGPAGRGVRAGHQLCPEQRQGHRTWSAWVARSYAYGQVPAAYGGRRQPSRET
jgi:uncharacterized protein YbjT (DUF2867 family)